MGFVFLNAAFATVMLHLISRVYLALFLTMLDKYLKYPDPAIIFIHHVFCWDICF